MKEIDKVVLHINPTIRNQLQIITLGLGKDSTLTQKEVGEKAVDKIVKSLLEIEQLIADTSKGE